jgi:catechol 2,3-dioxygenase-like lactoylglutathione lyase family enzyme
MATGIQVVIDCADPARLAEFWAAALGYVLQPPPPGFATWEDAARAMGMPEERWDSASAVVDPAGTGPRIFFQKVPEAKSGKNRVHLDVNASSGFAVPIEERKEQVEEGVGRLTALGATRVEAHEEFGGYHVVMRDPEGNEFCVQ